MKCACFAVALIAVATVDAARFAETPAAKVATLLENMAKKIDATGKAEQKSYDKFACWCEETMQEKAEDITEAKDKIEDLQTNIVKNKGLLGAGSAKIAQLKKDITENIEAMKEATEVRHQENTDYSQGRGESEECIGALEGAIKELTGAGTGKKGFLETLHQAELLSVVASMRPVLKARVTKQSLSQQNMEVVKRFVEQPEEFVKGATAFSQTGQNPFGDYAPQSTQIQGILKSMYDSFTTDLEKDNAEEGNKQKAYEKLKATKDKELATLKQSLQDAEDDQAAANKEAADDKAQRDATQEQLDQDEAFFKETKASCAEKAKHWAQRSRSRTQELDGIKEAIGILTSRKAQATFAVSNKFLQLSSTVHRPGDGALRAGAYKKLRSLASRYHSIALAQIAITVKTRGHFDDVIAMVSKMVASLREEEQEDIVHRDRCEEKQNANKNAIADAKQDIKEAETEIKRIIGALKDKKDEINDLNKKMAENLKIRKDLKVQREKDNKEFLMNLKADKDALALLEQAEGALKKFYKDTSALQVEKAKPAPSTSFDAEGGDYKGSTGEARGVLGILDMIKEDIRKEIKSDDDEEMEAKVEYEDQRVTLTRDFQAAKRAKANAIDQQASLKIDKNTEEDNKAAAETDKKTEESYRKAINTDCNWVGTHFEKRRKQRKAEIDGLNEASDFLAGVGTDNDLTLPGL